MEPGNLPLAAIGGIVLIITLVAYITLSLVLGHHWKRYEIESGRRLRVRIIYFTASAILWAFAFITFFFLL